MISFLLFLTILNIKISKSSYILLDGFLEYIFLDGFMDILGSKLVRNLKTMVK